MERVSSEQMGQFQMERETFAKKQILRDERMKGSDKMKVCLGIGSFRPFVVPLCQVMKSSTNLEVQHAVFRPLRKIVQHMFRPGFNTEKN